MELLVLEQIPFSEINMNIMVFLQAHCALFLPTWNWIYDTRWKQRNKECENDMH